MILKHRKVDPEVGKTQIEMALGSTLFALFSHWEAPFCSEFVEDYWRLLFGAFIVGMAKLDFDAAFADYDAIQSRMNHIGVSQPDSSVEKVTHFFCFQAQFIFGSLTNLVFLANYLDPAHDRLDWLHMIETGYGIPFCSGAPMPLVYFSTMLSSVIISYQSLLATLSSKKLIPGTTATNIISASIGVIVILLMQLLFANDMYFT